MKTPMSPGSVMVGVDGSTGSDTAVIWAATYAAAHRRPLAIVHGTGAPMVTDFAVDLDAAQHGLWVAGRAITDHALLLAHDTNRSLEVSAHVETREPRSLLAESAVEAHLLVLGSRGHGAVLSLLLGSVSVALAAQAPCPVVVVRAAAGDEDDRSVVVGVDGAHDSTDALTFAFELASEQNRPLEVLHAIGDAWMFPSPDSAGLQLVEELTADWQLWLAESVAEHAQKFPDVAVTSRLVQGSAAASLVAASEHASIVVTGARGRSALTSRLLGSVSRSVVEHAHSTVAVVRSARP